MNKERIPFSVWIYGQLREYLSGFPINDVPEYIYKEYLDCYQKSEFTSGNITIKTEDGVCSYYIKDTDGDYIKCCYIIPPYKSTTVPLYQNEELFIYENGIVRVYKDKFDTANLTVFQNICVKVILYIIIGFLFAFPLFLLIHLITNGITNGKIGGCLYIAYVYLLINALNYKYRKQRKLENQHRIYVEGFLKGRRNAYEYEEYRNNDIPNKQISDMELQNSYNDGYNAGYEKGYTSGKADNIPPRLLITKSCKIKNHFNEQQLEDKLRTPQGIRINDFKIYDSEYEGIFGRYTVYSTKTGDKIHLKKGCCGADIPSLSFLQNGSNWYKRCYKCFPNSKMYLLNVPEWYKEFKKYKNLNNHIKDPTDISETDFYIK